MTIITYITIILLGISSILWMILFSIQSKKIDKLNETANYWYDKHKEKVHSLHDKKVEYEEMEKELHFYKMYYDKQESIKKMRGGRDE